MKDHNYRSFSSLLLFIVKLCLITCSLSMAMTTNAKETQPLKPADLVKKAVDDITTELRANSEYYKNNPKELQAMVDQRTSLYFNFYRMTQIAAARYWRSASDQQKTDLTHEFKTQLLRTYSQTLLLYRNTDSEILSEQVNDKGRVSVKLQVKNDRGQPTLLFLLMEKNQDQWQIIDVNVEGVSIVITARGRFSEEVDKKGLDGFIDSLREENQRLAP